jgi:hypothetical protein
MLTKVSIDYSAGLVCINQNNKRVDYMIYTLLFLQAFIDSFTLALIKTQLYRKSNGV